MMPGATRRWTLNGDFVGLSPTGVARYARETVRSIDTLFGEDHPLTRDLDIDLVAPQPFELNHIPVRHLPEFRRPRLPQFWVQAQLPRHVPGGLVSFCNLAPVMNWRQIACIHDLHTFQTPESYPLGFRLAHRAILPLLGRRAARITTVSELSRNHLISHHIAPAGKIYVTYNGSDHVARWDSRRATLKTPTARPFTLCLGQKQKYKNCALICKVAPALDRLGIDIVMAGDVDRATIESFGSEVPPNVHVLGRLGDDDLAFAFSKALCFLFPSRFEGFGLPAVEAMALGCPLVASTAPCLPEVCGDAALYADPDSPQDWVEAVARLKKEPRLVNELAARGRDRAGRYKWRRIAEIYLELMVDLDREWTKARARSR